MKLQSVVVAAHINSVCAASCILCDAASLFRVTRHVLAPDPECIVTAPSIPPERWAGFHA